MKLKIKAGQNSAVLTADPAWKVRDLSSHLSGTLLDGQSITAYRYGFPSKSVAATSDISLQDAGIKANEQLVAETSSSGQSLADSTALNVANSITSSLSKSRGPTSEDKITTANDKIANVYIENVGEYLILRNVPDDNSCLFNAILYALTGSFKWPELNLRHIVAETIQGNPATYDEVVLGRPIDKYCEWIEKSESWGGAIELGILSDFLGVRINCFDVELGSMMVFQNEKDVPAKFIVLVYSGIHYDCFVTNRQLTETKTNDKGNWTTHQLEILGSCDELVSLLQKRNYTTNTTTFRVRCLQCYEVLIGEMGASKHAESTGHYRFGEVN